MDKSSGQAGEEEKREVYVYEERGLPGRLQALLLGRRGRGRSGDTSGSGIQLKRGRSQYHLADLRNFPADANVEAEPNLVAPTAQPAHVPEGTESEITTKSQLLERVNRLGGGFYRVTVAAGQLHFVRSGNEDTTTGRSELSDVSTERVQEWVSPFEGPEEESAVPPEVTVADVAAFLQRPGAAEAIAAFQSGAQQNEADEELRKSLGELVNTAAASLAARDASETERPTAHALQSTPADFDARAAQAAGSETRAARQALEDAELRTALDEQSSKDVDTARLPSDEELLELLHTAREAASDLDLELRTAVGVEQ
ncbi:hypothetical protein M3Y99_00188500 [Aphelenchoides fujianensis]|nr:hypothetical protein M3Y99_00188500 [Aphelenchoides fujianensis]